MLKYFKKNFFSKEQFSFGQGVKERIYKEPTRIFSKRLSFSDMGSLK
jgi:hypothetical protein